MTRRRFGLRWAVALLALVVALLIAFEQLPGARDASATRRIRDVPVDMSESSYGGEPQIAVNPKDPKNIVVGGNVYGVSFTRDGGLTWKEVSVPNIGDNVLTVQPNGTFLFSAIDGYIWASRDGGQTWAKRGNWVGAVADTVYELFPNLPYPANVAVGDAVRQVSCTAPTILNAGPVGLGPDEPGVQVLGCDRPWMVTDPSSGRVFLSFAVHSDASGGMGEEADHENEEEEAVSSAACHASKGSSPFQCGRQYVSASGDGGRTWSTFKPMDSATYPAGGTNGWSGGPVASFGKLATAYIAKGTKCPTLCIVFETSKDDGANWVRRVVAPVELPNTGSDLSTTFNFEPYTAADPSKPGRYALTVMDAAQKHLIVYVTEDSGQNWKRTVLGEPGDGVSRWTPWIAYGPSGALGATWRTAYADGTFDTWAAVSVKGGIRFAPAVKLSKSRSPGPVATGGDDAADVVLTKSTLLAAWGDQRGTPAPAYWFGSAHNHVGIYPFTSMKAPKHKPKRLHATHN